MNSVIKIVTLKSFNKSDVLKITNAKKILKSCLSYNIQLSENSLTLQKNNRLTCIYPLNK